MDPVEFLACTIAFCIAIAIVWANTRCENPRARWKYNTMYARSQQNLPPQRPLSSIPTTSLIRPATTIQPLPAQQSQARFDERLLMRLQSTHELFYDRFARFKWAREIVNLIRQAELEMKNAQIHLKTEDNGPALFTTTCALKRMSKAVLYSFGEKPDQETTNLEPLKLVSLKLQEQERTRLDACIERIAAIQQIEAELKGKTSQEAETTLKMKDVPYLVDSAANVIRTFKEILTKRFGTEIPELNETCPKCDSICIEMRNLERTTVTYTCRICENTWEQPRTIW